MDSDAIVSLTGSDFNYQYKELPTRCSDNEIQNSISRTKALLDPIARALTMHTTPNGLYRAT